MSGRTRRLASPQAGDAGPSTPGSSAASPANRRPKKKIRIVTDARREQNRQAQNNLRARREQVGPVILWLHGASNSLTAAHRAGSRTRPSQKAESAARSPDFRAEEHHFGVHVGDQARRDHNDSANQARRFGSDRYDHCDAAGSPGDHHLFSRRHLWREARRWRDKCPFTRHCDLSVQCL